VRTGRIGLLRRTLRIPGTAVALAVVAALIPAGVPSALASPGGSPGSGHVQAAGDGNWKAAPAPTPPPLSWKTPKVRSAPVLKANPHAKRVRELTGRRTANASFFQMSDGSVQEELSAVPVHYRDAKGAWQDINSSVKPLSHDGFTAGAVGNAFQAYFSSHAPSLVRVQQGTAFVQVGADGAVTSAPKVSGSTVTYVGAYPGTDIRYQAGPDGVLESIVLAKAPAAGASFSFTLKVAGLIPKQLPDGAIGLYGGESANPAFVIPAPYMADSKADASSPYGTAYSAKVAQSASWDPGSATIRLTVTPDASWLADAHRQYPVTIDPTILVSPTPSQAANVMILADGATTNYATSWRLSVGTTTTGAARTLIRFPMPSVPPGTTISSADLKLYYDQTFTTGSNTVPLQALAANAAWNPATATWSNASSIGGPVAGTSSMKANALDVWNDFPVTSTVQGWVNGTTANNGFVLKAASESTLGQGGPRYEGSIYAYGGEVVNYPRLVITYGVPGVAVNPPAVIHSTGAELSWPAYANTTGNSNNDLAEYQVHRSVFQAFTPSASTEISPVRPGTTSFTDSTAVPTPANNSDPYGNAYYYMVVVKTKSGALIPGPATLVRLPEAGRTTLIIPATSAMTLSSAEPDTVLSTLSNAGTPQPWLEVGDNSASYGTARAVFNFGALPVVPSGSTILDAHLKLWQETTTTGTSGGVYQLHALTRPFTGSQVTWKQAATGTAWTTAGGDFSAATDGTVSGLTNDPNRRNFDATSIVQGWVKTPASNDGLLVKLAAESGSSPQERTIFAGPATAEPALAPELVVTYLDSQQTYYAPSTPSDMVAGTTYTVPVTINNTTAATWSAANEVLTYHWLLPDGTDVTTPAAQLQTALPADLAPAGTVTLNASVTPPAPADGNVAEGTTLDWDMYNKATGAYLSGAASPAFAALRAALAGPAASAGLLAPGGATAASPAAAAGGGSGSLAQQVSVDASGNNQLGLQPYYSYTTIPTGAGSAANANYASGNVVWHDALFASPSRGFTTSLGLSYNSLSTMDTGTGFGWTVGASSPVRLGQALQFHPQSSPTSVVMVDSTGDAHQWNLNTTSNTWTSPPGEHLFLQQTGQCTQQTPNDPAWRMTSPDRTTVVFDCEGYPVSQADANGNTAVYSYTDKQSQNKPEEFLQYITDPVARQTLTLTYYNKGDASYDYIDSANNLATGTNLTDPSIVDHLKSVTDISGRTVNFYYTTEGLLARVVDGAGNAAARTFNFGYLATQGMKNVKLVSVTDPVCSAKEQQGQTCNSTRLDYYPDSSPFKWMAQTITDRDAHATGLAYAQPGTISGSFEQTTVTDANQHTTEFETDSAGRMIQVTDPLNHKTTQAWDADNNVTSLTEDNGAQTLWTYDPNTGYPLTETDPLAVKNGTSAATWIYSTADTTDASLSGHIADLSAEISAQGALTSYGYDGNGNLLSEQDPDGTAGTTPGKPYLSTFTYDSTGEMLTATDANGHAIDASGNITNVPGHTAFYGYDIPVPGTGGAITVPEPTGQPVSVTDPMDNSTSYTYGPRGEVLSTTDPAGNTSSYVYDVFGQSAGSQAPKDAAANQWVITPPPAYDANGNVTVATPDYLGSIAAGATTATGTPVAGSETTTAYDSMDRPVTRTLPSNGSGGSRVVTYGYDNLGNQTSVTSPLGTGTNAVRYTTTSKYDPDSQLTSVSQPADGFASPRVVQYGYNTVGDRTLVIDPDGNKSQVTYDIDHRKSSTLDAANHTTSIGYDLDGLVTATTDQNGATTQYTLDPSGQVTQVQVPHTVQVCADTTTGCDTTQYAYDQVGNRTSVISPLGVAAALAGTPDAFTTTTTYNADNLKTATLGAYLPGDPQYGQASRPETDYTYDADSRVKTIDRVTKPYVPTGIGVGTLVDHAVTTYSYFDNGWTSKSVDPFGGTTIYDYNGQGQQTNQVLRSAGFSDPVLQGAGPLGAQRAMAWHYNPDGSVSDHTDSGTPPKFDDQIMTAESVAAGQPPADNWTAGPLGKGYDGSTYYQSGNGVFAWPLGIPQDGEYQVYAYTSASGDPAAVYGITGTGSDGKPVKQTVTINQTQNLNQWVPLGGPVSFQAGRGGQQVELFSSDTGPTTADAIRLVKVGDGTTQDGPQNDFSYTYDANGNLSGITDASPAPQNADSTPILGYTPVTSYVPTFDNLGQLTQMAEDSAPGTALHTLSYGYDLAGNLTSQALDGASTGNASSYAYNNLNQLKTLTSRQSSADPGITAGYTYTPTGLPATETKSNGNVVTDNYNNDASLSSSHESTAGHTPVNGNDLVYDANGNITKDTLQLTDDSGVTHNRANTLAYSPAGQVKSISNPDHLNEQAYGYDSAGDLISQVTNPNGNGPEPITKAAFGYFHGQLSQYQNLTGLIPPPGGFPLGVYSYDTLGRLVNVSGGYTGGGTEQTASQLYNYDRFGNTTLQAQLQPDGTVLSTTTGAFDSLGRAVTETVCANPNPSSLTSCSGGISSTDTPQYLGTSGTVASEHAVDASTRSVDKSYYYSPAGERLAVLYSEASDQGVTPAAPNFYSYNQHGDVQALTGPAGATVATYGYSAYGVDDTSLDSGADTTQEPGTFPFNSFRFGSGHIDASTGNLGIGSRGYDPSTGSFTDNSAASAGNFASQAMLAAGTVGPEPSISAGGSLGGFLGMAGGAGGALGGAAIGAAVCAPTVVADPVCAAIGAVIGGVAGGAAGQGVACWTGVGSCSASAFGGAALNGAIWGGAIATGELLGLAAGALLGPDAALAGFADNPLTARAVGATIGAGSTTVGYGASCLVASDCSASGFAEAAATGALFGAVFGTGLSCGGESFTADTQVVLADGSTAPISGLKPGDKVLATDTKTGKTQSETVSAVEVNHDTDLYDLTVKAGGGTEVIHTTAAHLFWDPAKKKWVKAAKLTKGEHLKAVHGQDAVAVGGTTPATHDGWMWDLTVPGNNDHDFYVLPAKGGVDVRYYHVDGAGVTPVLVHNCSNLGVQVDYTDTDNPLVKAVHDRRILENDNTVKNYASALLEDGRIITGRAMGKGRAGIHAEEDLINQAGGIDKIKAIFTERAPCANKCDPLLRGTGIQVSYSFPWNDVNPIVQKALRIQTNADLKQAVADMFAAR
jgi:YD repeat-containing protein